MTPLAARSRRFWRSARLSLQLLAAHRLRTALSVTGLLAGVAAVMVMVAIGRGAEQRIVARVSAMGTDLVIVTAAPALRVAGRPRQSATTTLLRPADAQAIADESAFAMAAAAAVHRSLVVRAEGRNTTVAVTGTTPDGLRIRNVREARGRLYDESEDRERRRVTVLGSVAARTLFGDADPLGRAVRIGRTSFEVIGVARARGVDPGGADLDNTIAIPLETALRRVLNVPYVDAIYIQARSSTQLDALEVDVRARLDERHRVRPGMPEPFIIRNQAVILRTERSATRAFNQLIAGAATLALAVGGIGILAVMLMSVRERTREIGLRRAVGATRADIQRQFVIESTMLATAGAAAGVAVGLAASLAASMAGPWELVFSWRAAAAGVACSTVLGIAVGAIPAARAARLEPIAALRAE